jgi:D-alanine transaminase
MKVYLNGQVVDAAEARVPADDRGFLFADGVYEVVRLYGGKPFLMDAHMRRLRQGLAALQIDDGPVAELPDIVGRLIAENEVDGDGTIYLQITRGVAPRTHAFPTTPVRPTVYVVARPFKGHPASYMERGVACITVPDTRWTRCDIKSIALLPNVLANQAAHAAGAFEALFVRDGVVAEGSHANLFGVLDGVLVTYPRSNYILPGITRDLVLELADELGIPAREGPIYWDEFWRAEELFLSGTTTEVMPIAVVDGRPVGSGVRGPIVARLQAAYLKRAGG